MASNARRTYIQVKQCTTKLEVDRAIMARYGFVANPDYRTRHNLAIQLAAIPFSIQQNCLSNLSCHNLCIYHMYPPNYHSLLSLGLNFCP
jgi:hypothetical protein